MIKRISADRESFKTLEFRPGLNILVADKHEGATERDSRNGAGKTSFVELVHFLFGASAPPASIFRKALGDWKFRAEVEIAGEEGAVERSGDDGRFVQVAGALAEAISPPQLFGEGRLCQVRVSVDAWNASLGERCFGLERAPEDGGERFRPSFRSLFSYFARRVAAGGFQNPMLHSSRQQPWDSQVSLSWLLGLDWTISQRFQELREQEKRLKGLKALIQSGELARFAGGAAELRTELTLTRDRARQVRERLEAFRVLPDYEELEKEATLITGGSPISTATISLIARFSGTWRRPWRMRMRRTEPISARCTKRPVLSSRTWRGGDSTRSSGSIAGFWRTVAPIFGERSKAPRLGSRNVIGQRLN